MSLIYADLHSSNIEKLMLTLVDLQNNLINFYLSKIPFSIRQEHHRCRS